MTSYYMYTSCAGAALDVKVDPTTMDTQTEGGKENEDQKEKEKRTSRACLTCRKRKSACHL